MRRRWRQTGCGVLMTEIVLLVLCVVADGRGCEISDMRSDREPDLAPSQLVSRARKLEGTKDFEKALECYAAYLAIRPDDDEARGSFARVLSWQGRFDEAVAAYQEILTRHPVDIDVRVALARVRSWQRQWAESERLYRAVLDEDAKNVEARRGLADTLAWSGRPAEALPLYEAVYSDTNEAELEQRIHTLRSDLEAAALADLRASLDGQVTRARQHAWHQNFTEAERMYRSILSQEPSHLEAKQGLADTLYWSGRYADALHLYEEVYGATNDPALLPRIEAVQTELQLSARAPVTKGIVLPFRDYLKVGYSHYTYTNNVPNERDWVIEAAKPIGDLTLVGRVEPLNRFGLHDTPVSGELYSPLWARAWGYIGASGAVDAKFVPSWSLGGEVFQGLGGLSPKISSFEISLGYRHLSYKTADIELLMPGLTIYLPWNFWLSEKIYYVPEQGSITLSSQLTWRPTDRVQLFASGGFGTAGERIVAVQDFTRVESRIIQGGAIFPIAERWSGELSGYYEDRGALYVRRGGTFNLIWHW